jgi:hypothetical protein
MKKTIYGITDGGFGGIVFKIENDSPVNFTCEHCGPLRRKIYYRAGCSWCKSCVDDLDIVQKRPKTKFKKNQTVTYLNSFNQKVKAKVLCYLSDSYLDVMVPQSDGSKIRMTFSESDLELS